MFEDEMLDFERILHKIIDISLHDNKLEKTTIKETDENNIQSLDSD